MVRFFCSCFIVVVEEMVETIDKVLLCYPYGYEAYLFIYVVWDFVMYAEKSPTVITPRSLKKKMRQLGQSVTVNDCKEMTGRFDVFRDITNWICPSKLQKRRYLMSSLSKCVHSFKYTGFCIAC